MTFPVDSEGRFEAVDDNGGVVGEGRVDNGGVEFHYGDADPEGVRPHTLVMPVPEFELSWGLLPQSRTLTLRAAVS